MGDKKQKHRRYNAGTNDDVNATAATNARAAINHLLLDVHKFDTTVIRSLSLLSKKRTDNKLSLTLFWSNVERELCSEGPSRGI